MITIILFVLVVRFINNSKEDLFLNVLSLRRSLQYEKWIAFVVTLDLAYSAEAALSFESRVQALNCFIHLTLNVTIILHLA